MLPLSIAPPLLSRRPPYSQGLLLNRSRDLMREVVTQFPDSDADNKAKLAKWLVTFARVMRLHFQPDQGVTIEKELENLATPEEIEMLKASAHRCDR